MLSLLLFLVQEGIYWRGRHWRLSPQALTEALNHQGARLIDLRPQALFEKGHIVGAVSLPEASLELVSQRFSNDATPLIVVCSSGIQSARLVQQLRSQGRVNVAFLADGMATWFSEHLPLVQGNKRG